MGLTVLSLFDGISCGKLALQRAGLAVDVYYASEVDPYALKISKKNHLDIIQLGDILGWQSWDIDFSKIDLILAGFPCQAWSIAGRQEGIGDKRGHLALTLVDIFNKVRELNQKVKFLFENVKMKREFMEYLSTLFHVEPLLINSSMVSAQNRERYYWTNLSVTEPPDRGSMLNDIVENGSVDRQKAYCIDANYFKGGNLKQYFEKRRRQLVFLADGKFRKLSPVECERLQTLPDNYTAGVSDTQRYKMIGNGWTVDVISHILKGL